MHPIEGDTYLVWIKNNGKPRIATFNGFGANKGWGGQDWRGDSGFSSDSWMHDEVECMIPFKNLHIKSSGDDKLVKEIFYSNPNLDR